MEEASLLISMQRIISRIEIKDDLFRHLMKGLQKEVDKQILDFIIVPCDPVLSFSVLFGNIFS